VCVRARARGRESERGDGEKGSGEKGKLENGLDGTSEPAKERERERARAWEAGREGGREGEREGGREGAGASETVGGGENPSSALALFYGLQ
jgi:hypothetical protein